MLAADMQINERCMRRWKIAGEHDMPIWYVMFARELELEWDMPEGTVMTATAADNFETLVKIREQKSASFGSTENTIKRGRADLDKKLAKSAAAASSADNKGGYAPGMTDRDVDGPKGAIVKLSWVDDTATCKCGKKGHGKVSSASCWFNTDRGVLWKWPKKRGPPAGCTFPPPRGEDPWLAPVQQDGEEPTEKKTKKSKSIAKGKKLPQTVAVSTAIIVPEEPGVPSLADKSAIDWS